MYNKLTDFDEFCLANAVLFTAVRVRHPRNRTRHEFATIKEAETYATEYSDGRTIIYAVTAKGRSAPIKVI